MAKASISFELQELSIDLETSDDGLFNMEIRSSNEEVSCETLLGVKDLQRFASFLGAAAKIGGAM